MVEWWRQWFGWQALAGLVVTYGVLVIATWVFAGQLLWAAASGTPDLAGGTDRLFQAGFGLALAALGALLLLWLPWRLSRGGD